MGGLEAETGRLRFRDRCGNKEQRGGRSRQGGGWESPGHRPDHRPRARETQIGGQRGAGGGMDRNREWRERCGGRDGHEDRCEDRARDARETQAEKMCAPSPPHPRRWQQVAPGRSERGSQGQMWREEPAVGAGSDGRGCRLPKLAPPGVRGWGSGAGVLTARRASWPRLDSASVRQPRLLSRQQLVARGNQHCSRPARAEPPGARDNPGLRFPRPPSPTSGSRRWSLAPKG